jgi:hypothetical protein
MPTLEKAVLVNIHGAYSSFLLRRLPARDVRIRQSREDNRKLSPVPGDALHLNLAAVLSNDALCNGKAKPCALCLGGKEWMKDAFEIRSGDSYPLICDHELDGTTVAVRREPNLPSLRGCLECIQEQIDQDLADFLVIQACFCSASTVAYELNPAPSELVMQCPLHPFHEFIDIDLFSLERGETAEGKHVLRHLVQLGRLAVYDIEVGGHLPL